MADDKMQGLIDLYQSMINEKQANLQRLLLLANAGIEVGSPTLQDIIDREVGAMDNLARGIQNARAMQSRYRNGPID